MTTPLNRNRESKSTPPQQKCYLPTLYKTKLLLVPFFFSIYLFSWSSLARKVGAKRPYTLPPKKSEKSRFLAPIRTKILKKRVLYDFVVTYQTYPSPLIWHFHWLIHWCDYPKSSKYAIFSQKIQSWNSTFFRAFLSQDQKCLFIPKCFVESDC